jgi:hypothetical protein
LEEEAWNAYPYCKTIIRNPFLGERFSIIVETQHVDDDLGEHNNVFGIEPELMEKRTVKYIDIGTEKLPKEHENNSFEPAMVQSKKTGRGPLTAGWQVNINPMMCCYKLVTVRFDIPAFKSSLENWVIKTQLDYFIKFYKRVFCLLDDWVDLDMDHIRKLEDQTKSELDQVRTLIFTNFYFRKLVHSTLNPPRNEMIKVQSELAVKLNHPRSQTVVRDLLRVENKIYLTNPPLQIFFIAF